MKLAASCLILCAFAHAENLLVPQEYATINEAITASSANDHIIVDFAAFDTDAKVVSTEYTLTLAEWPAYAAAKTRYYTRQMAQPVARFNAWKAKCIEDGMTQQELTDSKARQLAIIRLLAARDNIPTPTTWREKQEEE